MEAAQPNAKIFTSRCELASGEVIALFQRWIQNERMDELLIDVVDYSHMHHGPGVVLVSHDGLYGLDHGGGRTGMSYRKRRGASEAALPALKMALGAAARAARALHDDSQGRVTFAGNEVAVGFADRLHAPNTQATLAALEGDLATLGRELFPGREVVIDVEADGRRAFGARLHTAAEIGFEELLERLG
jgi:hypothetical protein